MRSKRKPGSGRRRGGNLFLDSLHGTLTLLSLPEVSVRPFLPNPVKTCAQQLLLGQDGLKQSSMG